MKLISQSHAAAAASPVPFTAIPSPAPTFGELLSPSQLCLRLGISRRTLSNWTRDSLLPMVKIGHVCRFDYAKVCAVLERHEVPAADTCGSSNNGGSSQSPSAATPALS